MVAIQSSVFGVDVALERHALGSYSSPLGFHGDPRKEDGRHSSNTVSVSPILLSSSVSRMMLLLSSSSFSSCVSSVSSAVDSSSASVSKSSIGCNARFLVNSVNIKKVIIKY